MKSTIRTFGAVTVAERAIPDGPVLYPPDARTGQLHLSFVVGGGMQYAEDDGHGGSEVRLIGRGQAFLSVGDRRLEMTARGGCVVLTVSVPLLSPDRQRDGYTFYVMRGAVPLASPVFAFVSRLIGLDAEELDSATRQQAETLVVAMVGAITPQPFGAADSPATDPFLQAGAIMAARCADPHLRAEDVAHELSISLRQLERSFRAHGTTIVAELRRARVRQALTLLQRGDGRQLTVDQIARLVGFGTGSSLARAFRAERLEPPRHWRRH
ncbi:helix-turn-helix domain-containing protein [Microbacterium sp.]|uniref:helix-turn-helix domain-containing protein n=1 Tax=Microbacterium sp. TaxID=51671 RepID=UPI0039E515A2